MFFLCDCIELSAIQSDANIAHWGRGGGGRGGGVEELAPRTRDPNPKPHAPTTTQIARASTCSPVAGFRGGDGEMGNGGNGGGPKRHPPPGGVAAEHGEHGEHFRAT